MDGGGIDISSVLKGLISGVPIWGILIAALTYWLHRMKDFQKAEKERWDRIEKDILEIKLSLAASGISDVKKKLEDLNTFQIVASENLRALWKAIDPPKRRSDGSE